MSAFAETLALPALVTVPASVATADSLARLRAIGVARAWAAGPAGAEAASLRARMMFVALWSAAIVSVPERTRVTTASMTARLLSFRNDAERARELVPSAARAPGRA